MLVVSTQPAIDPERVATSGDLLFFDIVYYHAQLNVAPIPLLSFYFSHLRIFVSILAQVRLYQNVTNDSGIVCEIYVRMKDM